MAKRPCESQPRSRLKTTATNRIAKITYLKTHPLSHEWKSTAFHHAPGFWDLLVANGIALSLNKRTLQEFDRRNSLENQRRNLLEERPSKVIRAQIAQAELKRFTRLGGPDLSNIRGYPEPKSMKMTTVRAEKSNSQQRTSGSNRVTKSSSKTTKSGRSSAYKSDFMKLLTTDGVERARHTNKPANYDALLNRLQQPRGSLSPTQFSEKHREDFLDAVDNAIDEDQVMTDVFSVIKGTKSRPSRTNHACKNWVPLISADLVIPQPDFFDGAEQNAANSELRDVLDAIIVPSTSSDSPFLPNFFAEVKAPTASAEVARRQATYDGAFGARAMHHLKAYGASETFDGNAYTFTSTYTDGKLEIFAHYLTAPDGPGQPPHYHTASLDQWILTKKSVESFRSGITAFRNARDIAQETREASIADANQRMHSFSPKNRDKYINEAFQRTQEIVERNGSFSISVSTSRSNPPEEAGYVSQSDATDTTITPSRQAKKKQQQQQRRKRKPR